jgi:hypothetical protein
MARCDAPWVRLPHKLDVARFEARQNSKWLAGRKAGDQSLRDALKGKRSPYLSLVRLNEQMEVWVQLTGGGANRPLRIVIWADMAVLNQTTLRFHYRAVAAAGKLGPLLLPPEPESARRSPDERRLRAESLSLLCHREPDGKSLARLALEMTGVNRAITRNQQIVNLDPTDEPARSDCEGADAPPPLQICEPNERLLLRRLKGLVSSPISTQSATYYGEAWLGGSLGVLGVTTQLQAQEAVPKISIIAIRPRFVIVNKLKAPLQYHAAHGSSAASRSAPRALSDIVRLPPALVGHGSLHAGGGQTLSPAAPGDARGRSVDEPTDLGALPSLPPSACSPVYHFEEDTDGGLRKTDSSKKNLLSRLRLRLRVAEPAGRWSPPFPLNEATNYHYFAHIQPDARPRPAALDRSSPSATPTPPSMVVRISIREMAPTVFVCVEDATGTPPCCLRNEAGVPVWFAVVPPEARANAPLAAGGTTLALSRGGIVAPAFGLPGRGHSRHKAVVWHLLPPGAGDVPLLWDFHKMANNGRKVRDGRGETGEEAAAAEKGGRDRRSGGRGRVGGTRQSPAAWASPVLGSPHSGAIRA